MSFFPWPEESKRCFSTVNNVFTAVEGLRPVAQTCLMFFNSFVS